jgi:hypothetical protein
LRSALREAFKYPSFQLLMAGYFVCGFQVVFIGVHMPSYLKDKGLSPQVASYALALIGLFNVFGTYLRRRRWVNAWPKRKILAFIYLSACGGITIVPAGAVVALERLRVFCRHGVAVAIHRAARPMPPWHRSSACAPVHAGRVCVLQPPDWLVHGRLAGRLSVRQNRELRHLSGTSPLPWVCSRRWSICPCKRAAAMQRTAPQAA